MIYELLKKVSSALEERNIPYMISGSVAMITYAVPRMTRDIDIVINLKESDIDQFAEIFKEGFYLHKEGIREEVKRRGMFNVIDFESGEKIDFIVRKNTEFHYNEFERRIRTNAFGFEVWVVSIEDLIISKLNWIQQIQSDMQIGDIRSLLENASIDKDYLIKWVNRLSLNTFDLL
jgi:hypothetical protein